MQPILIDEESKVIYRKWGSSSPKAALLLIHGIGAQTKRWEFFAEFFLKHNISSYSLELKGFGVAAAIKGDVDSFKTYLDDIVTLFNIIKRENPGIKIFIAGESFGALLGVQFTQRYADISAGLICITPFFKNKVKLSVGKMLEIYLWFFVNPKKPFVLPFESALCTRDAGYQKVLDSEDSGEHRFATPRFLLKLMLAQMAARFIRLDLKIPVLFQLAGDDKIVDSRESKKVFENLKCTDKEIIEYSGMYHSLTVDIGKEKVFEDILGWINSKLRMPEAL